MVSALWTLARLPAGLSSAELESHLGDRLLDTQLLLGIWNSQGIAVQRDRKSIIYPEWLHPAELRRLDPCGWRRGDSGRSTLR